MDIDAAEDTKLLSGSTNAPDSDVPVHHTPHHYNSISYNAQAPSPRGITPHATSPHPGNQDDDLFSDSGESVLSTLSVSQQHLGITSKNGNSATLTNLLKGFIGTGILAMPAAFSHAGLMLGLFVLLIIAAMCVHCMHMLVHAEHTLQERHGFGPLDYGDVVEQAVANGPSRLQKYSSKARTVINVFLLFTQVGFCCVYVLFIASNIKEVIEHYAHNCLDLKLYMLFVALFLIPFCFIRHLRTLAPLSLLANVLTVLGLVVIFQYILQDLPDWRDRPQTAGPGGVALMFGTAIFAFEGIGIILPLENAMKHPKDFPGWAGVLNLGMVTVCVLYAAMGFYGYLQFGDEAAGSITLNLPTGAIYMSVRLMFSFGIMLSYLLMMYVPFTLCWPPIAERLQSRLSPRALFLSEYFFRTTLVLVTLALAIAIPFLDLFISLIGSLCSSTLAIIFPVLLDVLVRWGQPDFYGRFGLRLIKNAVILLVGVAGFIVGSFETIRAIVEAFQDSDSRAGSC